MSKVIAYGILFVLILALVVPVSASLVATAFGFPTITQTGTTTAFNRDTAAAEDLEAFSLSFPGPVVPTMCGAVGFPSIAQTVDQTQVLTHCDFATTNEQACFSYPFVGVGGCTIPGFGFGF